MAKQLFRFCKILMMAGGVWMQNIPNSGKFYQTVYKIYSVFNQLTYASSLIFFGVEFCLFVGDKDIAKVAENMSRMIFVGLVVCKLKLCQSKKIIKLLQIAEKEEIHIFSSNDDVTHQIYQENVKYCNNLIILIAVSTLDAGASLIIGGVYHSFRLYSSHSEEEWSSFEKPLLLPWWFPFDKNRYYVLALSMQIFHLFQSMGFNIVIQALVHSVMIFLKAQLKILQHQIETFSIPAIKEVNKQEGEDSILYILKVTAKRHQELIRWIEQFNDSIRYLLLLEYGVTSLMMASSLIQVILKIKLMFNVLYFFLCLVQIFLLAWNAHAILLESSDGIRYALYKCQWYEQSPQSKILISMMMVRCQKPLSLTIGPFGPMTVDSAVSRVRLSYTFLSVVNRMNF